MIDQLAREFAVEFHRLAAGTFLADGRDIRTAQFTASNYAEGVTSITLAFAAFFTTLKTGGEILVVETNLRQPAFAELLGVDEERSLIAAVTESLPLDEAIQPVKDRGFYALPAGRSERAKGDFFYQSVLQELSAVLGELKTEFRYILVDSPPVGPFPDATMVCRAVDGVIVVVESNVTRSEVLDHTVRELRSNKAEILGLVLNKRELQIPRWLYRFL